MLLDNLTLKTKSALNMSIYYCPLFSKTFYNILEKSECEDDFKEKLRNELAKHIDNLRDAIRDVCGY